MILVRAHAQRMRKRGRRVEEPTCFVLRRGLLEVLLLHLGVERFDRLLSLRDLVDGVYKSISAISLTRAQYNRARR